MRDKRRKMALPASGGSALLVIFAVLALTVFSLLSLSTALAEKRLSVAAAESAAAYYAADAAAEEIFARLRRGETAEIVQEQNGQYSYACPVTETQELQVTLQKEGESWRVLRWQTVSSARWEEDENLQVWDGGELK